ncbi:hypothetical protein NE237_011574 [Protea cynaroides]|uniref:Uncharacterized protein n=1 Tax=Protea cynaroides TaxID=273540 RepID=A0A9Q0GXD2_9MAGN|nr:hypothetical protein NE237_011574 [Protea cynaroides]
MTLLRRPEDMRRKVLPVTDRILSGFVDLPLLEGEEMVRSDLNEENSEKDSVMELEPSNLGCCFRGGGIPITCSLSTSIPSPSNLTQHPFNLGVVSSVSRLGRQPLFAFSDLPLGATFEPPAFHAVIGHGSPTTCRGFDGDGNHVAGVTVSGRVSDHGVTVDQCRDEIPPSCWMLPIG